MPLIKIIFYVCSKGVARNDQNPFQFWAMGISFLFLAKILPTLAFKYRNLLFFVICCVQVFGVFKSDICIVVIGRIYSNRFLVIGSNLFTGDFTSIAKELFAYDHLPLSRCPDNVNFPYIFVELMCNCFTRMTLRLHNFLLIRSARTLLCHICFRILCLMILAVYIQIP